MSAPETDYEADYLCVGVCMEDADSGYCLGCGRPPPPAPRAEPMVDGISRTPATSLVAAAESPAEAPAGRRHAEP